LGHGKDLRSDTRAHHFGGKHAVLQPGLPRGQRRCRRGQGRSDHFKSKDDLVAAYLAARDQPNLALFKHWFTEADGKLPDKVEAIFRHLARSARHPKWKGCGFLRTTAELANLPGHPAIKIGAAHKKKFEDWLRATFEAEGIEPALPLARQILLLLDGSFAVVLLHRDPSYMETAGWAASSLIAAAMPARSKSRPGKARATLRSR
jgi:AcrR family transcriptional regulator